MYSKYTSTAQQVQCPKVQTYPNHDAIIDMKLKHSNEIIDKTSSSESGPINKDKDENLLMLILTLMLSLDGESDGILYLLIALTVFIDN
jgi:hypothetical protein